MLAFSRITDRTSFHGEAIFRRGLASAAIFALVACNGPASSVPSAGATQYFQAARLGASAHAIFNAQNGTAAAVVRHASDVCAGDLALGASNDVWDWVTGSYTSGSKLNYGQVEDSLGHTDFITSPMNGGYNLSVVQANVVDPSNVTWNYVKSYVLTTDGGKTVVSESAPASSTGAPILSIVDNGATMGTIPLNTPFTLSTGEIMTWDGTTLTQSAFDNANSNGNLYFIGQYYTSNEPNMNFLNVEVDAWEETVGGWLVDTAINPPTSNSCASGSTSGPPTGPHPTPVPQQPTAPPATPTPCALPSGSPNPHPTQDTQNAGCSS